jgi:hypothetical protein
MDMVNVKHIDPTRVSLQCGWCNRFFSNERGVVRHKAYCSWSPQRLKMLKEERKRKREEKAVYKRSREGARIARQFENSKKVDFLRAKQETPELDGRIKQEPHADERHMSSLPASPSSSVSSSSGSGMAPLSPQGSGRVDPEVLKRPAVFSCQTKVRLPSKQPVQSYSSSPKPAIIGQRVSVIASCDLNCPCGCKKIRTFGQNQTRKSSLADSPLSFNDEDEDEIINVDT